MPPPTQDASPAPTGVDWYQSPQPIGPMDFRPLMEPGGAPTGLRELGPPPGGEDVERALGPLYQTGAEVAESIKAFFEFYTNTRRRSVVLLETHSRELALKVEFIATVSYEDIVRK